MSNRNTTAQLINVGFGNMISLSRIVAVVHADSAPVKRIVQEAKEKGQLVDATSGRKTKAVVITDSDTVVLSALQPEKIASRANSGDNQEDDVE